MSERESQQGPAENGEPISTSAEPPAPAREAPPPSSRSPLWLAGLLVLVLAAVALSPLWAPQIAPLLPWGAGRVDSVALESRLAATEARPVVSRHEFEATQTAANDLVRRVGQLEIALDAQRAEVDKKLAAGNVNLQPINSALEGLSQRIQQLETAAKPDPHSEAAIAAARSGLQQVEQRVSALETQSASRLADEAAAKDTQQQQLAKLNRDDADLAQRVAALERAARLQSVSELRADGMLALLLAQMREAVEQARPFPTEFNAFVKLAKDPEVAAAAQPLAEAARNGVASRAVLERRLDEMAGAVAAANQPQSDDGWGAQTLARLRGLVTIRRIEGSPDSVPEAAVKAARAALARGDLAGAVDKIEQVTGASADAARPWLQMARERLAVETALEHVQELLTLRIGGPAATPASPPAEGPEETDKARTRS